MRLTQSIFALTAVLFTCTAAWSPEDHEIFRLRDEVRTHEGDNATFYSFLGVKPAATLREINSAWRKQSLQLHPDKARTIWLANYDKTSAKVEDTRKVQTQKSKKPSQRETNKFNKEASARYARLGVVTNVLRGEDRKRYDHFLYNGFPKWRGTGYYYERFRPGLISVLAGLFIFVGGGVHYLVLYMGYKQQKDFVNRYIKQARKSAWGNDSSMNGIPGLGGPVESVPVPQDEEEAPSQVWNRREKRAAAKDKKKEVRNPKRSALAAKKAREEGISTPQEPEIISGPVGAKKRTVAPNGKVLIVDSAGNVWLEQESAEGARQEFLLDPEGIDVPTVYDTVLFKLPKMVYNKSIGRILNKNDSEVDVDELVNDEEQAEEDRALGAATAINGNGDARKRRSKIQRRRS